MSLYSFPMNYIFSRRSCIHWASRILSLPCSQLGSGWGPGLPLTASGLPSRRPSTAPRRFLANSLRN